MLQSDNFLVVGLGNPGERYARTRHNLGAMAVKALADRLGWPFKRGWRIKGKVASGLIGEKKLHLLLPTTYMNLSGQAVGRAVRNYSVPVENTLVVVDDVYLKLGVLRLKVQGGTGGHNGLKSVQGALRTTEYPRLRMGVGGESLPEMALEDYVLGDFSKEEQQRLPSLLERSLDVILSWMTQGIEPATQLATTNEKD